MPAWTWRIGKVAARCYLDKLANIAGLMFVSFAISLNVSSEVLKEHVAADIAAAQYLFTSAERIEGLGRL